MSTGSRTVSPDGHPAVAGHVAKRVVFYTPGAVSVLKPKGTEETGADRPAAPFYHSPLWPSALRDGSFLGFLTRISGHAGQSAASLAVEARA